MSFTCRHLFSDCTYIRTDETEETASGGGFDSFENWFRFQQNKLENRFRFLKGFTQQMDSFQNQVRTATSCDIINTYWARYLDLSLLRLSCSLPIPVRYLTCSLPTLSLPIHVRCLAFSLPVFFATLIVFQTNIRKALCFIFIYLFVHIYNKILKNNELTMSNQD